jgi:hypothetical protein
MKDEGWKNAVYETEDRLVGILGRYAAQHSRRHRLPIYPAPQIIRNGRRIKINQYSETALAAAFQRLIEERKVNQQKIMGFFAQPLEKVYSIFVGFKPKPLAQG